MRVKNPDAPDCETLRFASQDRVLVLAPHPDDETIACGSAITTALKSRAQVRIVLATDGDNNPWPQRRLERIWRIGAADRRRWGARRRAEADAALDRLGVHATQRRYLGWPDQGLTELLLGDGDSAAARIAAEIVEFAPTHIFSPSLRDTHPDHSALHVLVWAALRRCALTPERYDYRVHGLESAVPTHVALHSSLKHVAIDCHRSQLQFGRQRLERFARLPETFERATGEPRTSVECGRESAVRCDVWRQWCGQRLLAVGVARDGSIVAAHARLPRFGANATWESANPMPTQPVPLRRMRGNWHFELPWGDARMTYLKLDHHPRGVWIFDQASWLLGSAAPGIATATPNAALHSSD
ncbi:MAG: PIG-L family deacetylase [Tahibacter sp.]